MSSFEQHLKGLTLLLGIAILSVFITELVVIGFTEQAFGDDTEEPLGLCIRGYETHCQPTWKEQLLQRLQEWNTSCYDDESLCVLGIPDPDNGDYCSEDYCMVQGKPYRCQVDQANNDKCKYIRDKLK